MEGGMDYLVVHGFAVREGRGKWACCFEIRLAGAGEQPLLYRGELHGRRFDCEHAAAQAAHEAGQREAVLRVESLRALIMAQYRLRLPAATLP
ncbi:hypothetical protein ACIP1U_17850 [Cupriavidus sp. NPDC089707]|uniref:hypothetical protein n=1 Tax=Cupriavidus sp. NPDC089707 TaxID=3363963 RepID=UPI00382747B9